MRRDACNPDAHPAVGHLGALEVAEKRLPPECCCGKGGSEALGSENDIGGGIPLLPAATGWKPLGELRLRMLRATSQSSHERESGKVISSSDSIGETEACPRPRQWVAPPPMAIGAELPLPLPLGNDGVRADGGGGRPAPLSYRANTWSSPCASTSHFRSCSSCSCVSAVFSSRNATAALPGPLVQCASSSLIRACSPAA